MNEKGVSNNSYWRGKSDQLDKSMGWEGDRKYQSGARGFIHGTYHAAVGVAKYAGLNFEGGNAEMRRAGEQFGTGAKHIGRTPPKN